MFGKFLIPAIAVLPAAPSAAAVTVLGASSARLCFEAAESAALPSNDSLDRCDAALSEEAISGHDTVATYVNRGILKLRRGDVAAAVADFDEAIARDPKEPEAYLNKGSALMRNPATVRAALPLFTTALEYRTSRPAIAYYGRALAHEELGNIRAAYFDFQRAAAADPKWREPAAELARFTVRKN